MKYNYSHIELELQNLISVSSNWLTENEASEVSKFLEVNEYGLAFETLCYIIIEEDKKIPQDTYDCLAKLGKQMSIETTLLLKVNSHVKNKC